MFSSDLSPEQLLSVLQHRLGRAAIVPGSVPLPPQFIRFCVYPKHDRS